MRGSLRGVVLSLALAGLACSSGGGGSGNTFGGARTAGSHDFNVCALDSEVWTFVDPRGDSEASIVGAGSGDARLAITAPGGRNHDPWGTNDAARLMQRIDDVDFELEAKFDSAVSERFQLQGLMVEGGTGNWVRMDVFHDGSSVNLFVGSVSGGNGEIRFSEPLPSRFPVLLRLARRGDSWTASHSYDGASWTEDARFDHGMSVDSVGVFAGNAGGDPAHTALVDYFTRLGPIEREDQAGVATQGALSVDASGNGTVDVSPARSAYACGERVSLTARPAPGWSFVGWSGALSGSRNPETLTIEGNRSVTARFETSSGPPAISGLRASDVTSDSAVVEWTTDQPASSILEFGRTSGYELGRLEQTALVTGHAVALSGLAAATRYHYRATSSNERSETARSGDRTFTTADAGGGGTSDPGGPEIDVWYGDRQRFGDLGVPQPYVNVLGNVYDPDGVASLSYRVNGGASRPLSQGPDDRRLAERGDFNADVPIGDLRDGTNSVAIRAVDSRGKATTRTVDVVFDGSRTWPRNYTADWSRVGDPNDAAQVVDGLWEVDRGSLRNLQMDYDRLVAIGDLDWDDYEVEVPITVHGIDPGGFEFPSTQPAVGILMRWPGHRQRSKEQPFIEFTPLGAIGWVVFTSNGGNKLQIFPNSGSLVNNNDVPNLEYDVTYVFKFRVEQNASGGRYRFKMWPQGSAEPGWQLEKQQTNSDPRRGSAVLVAHHVDARFGNVIVRRL
jgi:hypothetical protein